MEKIKTFLTVHKRYVILLAVLLLLGVLGWWGIQKFTSKEAGSVEEVDLIFDAEGPYGLTFPRKDGNALILNLKRTASYDSITYELAYTSRVDETAVQGGKILYEDKLGDLGSSGSIDRVVVGTIDTKDKKGEYEQEILFGTCSKNVCKYDKGVENGTLTLHIRKEDKQSLRSNDLKAFRMITQWHLQKPDVALGQLTSGDGHFVYKVNTEREALANVGFSIINDLTGVPKLPSRKEVLGKVYSLNVPIAKNLPSGEITVELAQNSPSDAKIYRFNEPKSEWQELDTKIAGSKLFAKADGAGIFAVLILKK